MPKWLLNKLWDVAGGLLFISPAWAKPLTQFILRNLQ